ncbi:MAG: tryptophan synthase subunit alpha [Candidatus Goldiibacteriota bacterium]|jgi:tryptophan synthase alpha chain
MNRIDALKDKSKKHLVIYTMAGDPDISTTEDIVRSLAASGVSLIEIGVPFSDPVADGPTIQRAGERAIANGTTMGKTMDMVNRIRKSVETPLVFMLYYNLILSYGIKKFVDDALKAGVDGAIIPDLPFDEEAEFYNYCKKRGFYVICLVSPTNTPGRMKKIVEKSDGFVYYILQKGVTGARKSISGDLKALRAIKKEAGKPVFAGFGISTPGQAFEVAAHADGVIIGSAFVSLVEKFGRKSSRLKVEIGKFVKNFLKRL